MAISQNPQSAHLIVATLVHVFGAADCGVSLVNFKGNLEALEKQMQAGDEAATDIFLKLQGVINLVQYFGDVDNENFKY